MRQVRDSTGRGGTVGTGGLSIGNANNTQEYPADPNDANGYAGESTKTVKYTNDERRTFTLSNGSVIWDMSGNVWEHVARSTNNQGDLTNAITTPACSAGTPGSPEWCQYGNSTTPYITAYNDTSFNATTIGPPNSSWNSSQDIGQVQGTDGNTWGSIFLRGGYWSLGSDGGAFALGLSTGPTYAGSTLGFRCAR